MTQDTALDQSEHGARQVLAALMEAAVDAIIVIDADGLIRLFNRGAERLFGYAEKEVLGRNVKLLMPRGYREQHDDYMATYHRTGRKRIIGIGREVSARSQNGEEFPIDLAVGETRIDGEPVYVGIIRDLRQRTLLRNMLAHEQDRATRVYDLVEGLIVAVDRRGRIQIANRKSQQLLAPAGALLDQDWLGFVHEDDRDKVAAALVGRFDAPEETTEGMEFRVVTGEGATHHLAWRLRYLPGDAENTELAVFAGMDLTRTLEITRKLRHSEAQLRLNFEQAPVGIARLDPAGKLDAANATLGRLLACDPATLHGRPFARLLEDRRRPAFLRAMAALLEGRTDRAELVCSMLHDTQLIKARLIMGVLRDAEQRPISVLVQIEDRTEQEAVEAEMEQMRNRLAHVQRLSVMGEMAAGIAHEINQPLGAIATYSDGARRLMSAAKPRMEDVGYALEQIGEQARRAGEVVRRMRAMASNQAITRKPHDLNGLIEGVIGLAELESRNLGAPLHTDLAPALPPVRVDEVQIQQVLLNLIRNSLEALATRSQASAGITISTRREGGRVVIGVADHGVGISEEAAHKVFEPFYSSKPTGTGIGLSICSTIVRAHEGRLWYEPNEGGGSRFLVSLPCDDDKESSP